MTDQKTLRQRSRLISAEPKDSPVAWWKTVRVPITASITKRRLTTSSVYPPNNSDTDNNTSNGGGRCEGTPTALTTLGGELTLSGVSLSPSTLVPTKPPNDTLVELLELSMNAQQKDRRERERRFLRRGTRPTPTFRPANRLVNTREVGKEEGAEPFLDVILRTYENELHRCIRGRNGMERILKKTRNAKIH
ncbi:hypothetical protein TraAM80_06495 [Trypanosoma rangeli]|uniref:Uncharacterized protein n=1 Tax=Trypanosoma rangeli TaxID=5698 RepID=A0A3R7MAA6_TRYRA|nr:uncharacterized protein TraAM80_06495 [Trypanosoma rangeli]RNF02264.1 hypothetical protein TraAM80_06495 [Trypanosoma rangeli]|eukprot:RNF02264.1 hypothetical protein TraAM80_06495 [Trypanosoma rangeli]